MQLSTRNDEQLAELAAIVSSTGDAIVGTRDGVITSWNPGAERLYGYTAAEVVGRSIALIIPPDRPDELPGIMARLRRGERIEHYDTVRVRKDGRRIDVSISIAPLKDATGASIGASTIARDITGRRRAEETQRLLADASRAFAEASLDLPAVLDIVARRVVEALGGTCLIRLVSADGQWLEPAASYHPDPEARAFGEAMFAAAPERVTEGLNGRVMQTGQPVLIPVVDQERFRAAIKPEYAAYLERFGTHSVLIVPLRVRGRLLGVLSAARETPGRPYTPEDQALLQELADRAALAVDNARLYQEAQEAIRARDQFLSIASHELRTPITSLKGYAQLLLRAAARDRVDPARLARYLRSMDELVNHLNELTEDLLNVARLRTGQLALQPRPLDLAALVREVAARYQDHLEDGHHLVVEAGAVPCPVVADARRLEQVLTNLLDNALKYSPDGGEIRVSLRREEDGNVLSVRDEGIGLPPGSDDAIFAPFERTSSAEARQIPGLGLGLYISRSIVERHGGRIWAESAGENRGATVSFWLPCGGGLAGEGRGARGEGR